MAKVLQRLSLLKVVLYDVFLLVYVFNGWALGLFDEFGSPFGSDRVQPIITQKGFSEEIH